MSDRTALILAIASKKRNLELMSELLRQAGYEVRTAESVAEFDGLITSTNGVSLIVLDIDGFTQAIWERCEQIKKRNIPMLVLARRLTSKTRQKVMSKGAYSVLEKPVRKAELRESVQALVHVDQ